MTIVEHRFDGREHWFTCPCGTENAVDIQNYSHVCYSCGEEVRFARSGPGRMFSADEDAYIREHYGFKRCSEMAVLLGRSTKKIEKRGVTLGLKSTGGPLWYGKTTKPRYGKDHHNWREPGVPWIQCGRRVIKREDYSLPVAYARYLWEQEVGSIPPDHAIRHINGNSLDDRLENLECISLAENGRRNSIARYPRELRKLIHLRHRVARKLRKHYAKE